MLSAKNVYIYRSFHTTLPQWLRRARRANPGADYHISEFETTEELEEEPESYGNMEADFMSVHKTHREHEQEIIQQKEKVRHLIVKQKYFQEPRLPNLLTYAEKEQMRLLHARNPEEWSADKLAESFPSTPEIVKKILKAKWKPRSNKRVQEHDEAVMRNWEKIRTGQNDFVLPPELRCHLEKFAKRDIKDLNAIKSNCTTRPELPKPKKQEFLSIITSCPKYAKNENNVKNEQKEDPALLRAGHQISEEPSMRKLQKEAEAETYLLDSVKDTRAMRFDDMKKLKLSPAELAMAERDVGSHELTAEPSNPNTVLQNPSGTGIISKSPSTSSPDFEIVQKFQSNEIVISSEDQKRYEMSKVKERIYIPRKLWRKGAIFRIEDCYYDDDGEFLYRVPGMTG